MKALEGPHGGDATADQSVAIVALGRRSSESPFPKHPHWHRPINAKAGTRRNLGEIVEPRTLNLILFRLDCIRGCPRFFQYISFKMRMPRPFRPDTEVRSL